MLFREAVNFTAAETGFSSRLIEKDYFCSVLLQRLAAAGGGLVFKGGTCLAKVYPGFYRLSEDLDFMVSMPAEATRGDRSRRAAGLKSAVADLGKGVAGLHVVSPLTGAHESSQYIAVAGYASSLARQSETIRIEVGLRESLLTPAVPGEAETLLLDPISGKRLVPAFPVPCLSREEAMAEKLRAALCRREAAIRDFYDLDHAVRRSGLRMLDPEVIGLTRKKLRVQGNAPMDVSESRLATLRAQLEPELKPVLRDRDFSDFDLERSFALLVEVAAALGRE